MSQPPALGSVRPVGRYALGVAWADGHDSIFPYRSLRAHCPCDACSRQRERSDAPVGGDATLESFEQLGDASIFLRWADGHESFFPAAELRALCRCALCAGEPERPITG